MEVFLHKICGQPVQPPVSMQLRRCTPEQAPAVYALQNEVRAAMPDPEQFVPDTLENITAYVRNDLCIGAWQGSRLGGYLIVRFCGRSAHNYAAFMDVPRTEWEHWANADSAFSVCSIVLFSGIVKGAGLLFTPPVVSDLSGASCAAPPAGRPGARQPSAPS